MLTQRRMLPTRACTTTAFLAFVFQSRQYPKHWPMVSMVQEETCSSNRREDISVVASNNKRQRSEKAGERRGIYYLAVRTRHRRSSELC